MVRRLFFSSVFPADRTVLLVSKYLNMKLDLSEVETTRIKNSKEFKQDYFLHPIPRLEYDDTTIETGPAIVSYLLNMYDKGGKIYPINPEKRALVDKLVHFNTGVLSNKAFAAIGPLIHGEASVISRSLKSEIERVYEATEAMLSSTWLAGDNVTVADLSCVPSITTIDLVSNVSKSRFPKLYRYIENCQRMPHYKEANQWGLDRLTKIILENLETARRR